MPALPNVFVSYAREDAAVCAPLLEALAAWGAVPRDIIEPEQPGAISSQAQAAIAACDVFLRLCTFHTPKSYWMTIETGAFLSLQAEEQRRKAPTRRMLINVLLDPAYARMPFDASTVSIDLIHLPPAAWTHQLRTALGLPPLPETEAVAMTRAIQAQVAAQTAARRHEMSRRRALQIGAGAIVLGAAGGAGLLWRARQPQSLHNFQVPPTPAAHGGNILWSHTTGDRITAAPVLAGTTLYVGSQDGYVYALDVSHGGNELWHFNTGKTVYVSPLLANGLLYLPANGDLGALYALDASSGKLLWQTSTLFGFTTPVVAGGRLYMEGYATDPSLLRKLDAGTGKALAFPETRANITCGPRLVGKLIYAVGQDPDSKQYYAYALRLDDGQPDDGKTAWKQPIGEAIRSTPAYGRGKIYIGSTDGQLYSFDALTGGPGWRAKLGSPTYCPPTYDSGSIYIGDDHGTLHVVDATSGSERWHFQAGDFIRGAPVITNGRVYVGSGDHNVYALDLTGKLLATYATNGAVYASPVVAGDMLYVTSTDRYVYAIHTS
jgi:outer membrane protein assembly factor BamB